MYRMIEKFTGALPNNSYNLYIEAVDPTNKIQNQILDNEQTRLENKKEVIDPIYFTKQRQNAQLRSTTLRKQANYRLLMVFFGTFILSMLLLIMRSYFPVLPEWLYDWLLIFIVGGGIAWMITIYADIQGRDKMDFEKVDFGKLLEVKSESDESDGLNLVSTLTTDVSMCVGADCCTSGYFVNNVCQPCPEGMRTNAAGECVNYCEDGQTYRNGKCESDAENFQNMKNKVEAFTTKPTYVMTNKNDSLIGKPFKTMYEFLAS